MLATGPLPAGTYLLLIEGFGAAAGSYAVEMSCVTECGARAPAALGASCAGAIACGGSASGDTQGAASAYGYSAGDAGRLLPSG